MSNLPEYAPESTVALRRRYLAAERALHDLGVEHPPRTEETAEILDYLGDGIPPARHTYTTAFERSCTTVVEALEDALRVALVASRR